MYAEPSIAFIDVEILKGIAFDIGLYRIFVFFHLCVRQATVKIPFAFIRYICLRFVDFNDDLCVLIELMG